MGTSGPNDLLADTVPNGWTRVETFYAAGPESSQITVPADNGPSVPGDNCLRCTRSGGGASGDWTVVEQAMNLDASQYSALSLSIDVKVDSHDLEAGGVITPAWEWPVILEVEYEPTSGSPATQIWRYGWYVNPPGDSIRPLDPGEDLIAEYRDQLVTAGQWVPNTFDLFQELPQLGTLTRIRVGGSGWNFEGQADNLVLSATGHAVPEPAGIGLVLVGLAALGWRRRRR
jgi:hypothetical protein